LDTEDRGQPDRGDYQSGNGNAAEPSSASTRRYLRCRRRGLWGRLRAGLGRRYCRDRDRRLGRRFDAGFDEFFEAHFSRLWHLGRYPPQCIQEFPALLPVALGGHQAVVVVVAELS